MPRRAYIDDETEATASALPVPRGIVFHLRPGATVEQVGATLPGWEIDEIEGMADWFEAVPPPGSQRTRSATPNRPQPIPLNEFWKALRDVKSMGSLVDQAEPLLLIANPETGAAIGFGLEPFGIWGWPYDAETKRTMARVSEKPDWHLDQLKVPDAWKRWREKHPSGEPGEGVVIGHPDTGFTNHYAVVGHLRLPGRSFLRDELGQAETEAIDDLRGDGGIPDQPGHGTSTASVIVSGAEAPPSEEFKPVSGVAPGAKILPLRVSRSVIHFDFGNVGRAIAHAVDAGADVISMSLGGPIKSEFLRTCIARAHAEGVIVISAAGNMVPSVVFPAAFPEVVAVAATHAAEAPWRFSGLGRTVDIAAPGEDVWCARTKLAAASPAFFSGQGTGTSFATACVAGLAALWLSYWGGRDAVAAHYGNNRAMVPLAFQYLLVRSANNTRAFVQRGKYGAGIADANKLLTEELPDQAEIERFRDVIAEQPVHSLSVFSRLLSGLRGLTVPSAITLTMEATVDPAGNLQTGPAAETPAVQEAVEAWESERRLLGRFLGEQVDQLSEELLARIAADRALLLGFQRWQPGESLLPLFDRLLPPPERQTDIALSRELLERLRLQRELERRRQRLLHQGRMSPPLEPARREPTEPPATPSPAETTPTYRTPAEPAMRLLRAYAFDPSQETRLTTARINQVTIPTRWEPLKPGPVGEYLEVIDIDLASGCAYAPIDLDHPHVLAQDGLTPSEGDPQFHQQVVYAVAMNAIHRFERALGRPIFWAPLRPWLRDRTDESDWYTPESLRQIRSAPDRKRDRFVQRLRVYPHALREANAYYSPRKRSLLFGYFPGSTDDTGTHYPGGMVFTCLSHDIIVHETTHALLDGMLPYLNERSNEDVLAFHEAFADIMALFQHFTFREVLLHQIAHTRGDLRTDNLLGQLAQQFGEATGKRGALRNALGEIDPRDNTWKRHEPDPRKLRGMSEPHERGSILVAAVFDAFLALYNDRIADLLRLATGGTGVIPAGQIHPDLVNRLAAEAAQTAETVLEVCIRALDYLPPVEVTFGDFLRSLITADFELSPSERRHRIAFIEAFRSWGIYPRDISTLSEDSLRWRAPEGENGIFLLPGSMLQQFEPELDGLLDSIQAWNPQGTRAGVQPGGDRASMFNRMLNAQVALNRIIKLGQQTPPDQRLTIPGVDLSQKASFSISNLRLARRIGPLGDFRTEMMFTIVQTPRDLSGIPEGDIVPRGGATCIVDLRTWQVRYVVYKRLYEELPSASLPDGRLASRFASRTAAARGMAAWLGEGNQSLADQLAATYEGWSGGLTTREPFALLHRTMD